MWDATLRGGLRLAREVRAAIRKAGAENGAYLHLGRAAAPAPVAFPAAPFAPADHRTFASYLQGRRAPQVFPSLRGTPLVVPAADPATYAFCGDVARFSRLPYRLQAPFWQRVAAEVNRHARLRPGLQVRTHGRDVPWLHVRID